MSDTNDTSSGAPGADDMKPAGDRPGDRGRLRIRIVRARQRWAGLTRGQQRLTAGLVGGLALVVAAGLFAWVALVRGLPDARELAEYQPPLPTNVRAIDGTHYTSFARERRIYLPYHEVAPLVIQAFLSAEDKNFYQHGGLDFGGIVAAVATNVRNLGGDRRPVGASTITQQVAKNLLLTNEVTITRKLREAVLAMRMERIFTKEQILELYLNEIFLGRNAYGVEAAAQAWFGKPSAELTVSEAAFIAGLPKAPSTYNPDTNYAVAVGRRNWVLQQMVRNGFVAEAVGMALMARPLVPVRPSVLREADERVGDYFLEEVRRQLIARFGETAADGPNSVYAGGLWVRTTMDPVLQAAAERALREGLVRYEQRRGVGWRGPAAQIELGDGWERRLARVNLGTGLPEWRPAVVLARSTGALEIGFLDGSRGRLAAGDAALRRQGESAFGLLRPGDVVPVETRDAGLRHVLRQVPEVSGALVVQEAATGRVLAMVGGFDLRLSSFNRATQAERQPGSAFKPFVFAAALESGMSPATLIADSPYCVFQSRALGQHCFRNFSGGYAGMQTMRWGLEQSRNLMTVRAADTVGMDRVVAKAKALGIGDYPAVLAISLGAGETTPMRLVNAYSMLVNGGRRVEPVLFDLVQDRHGQVIHRADGRVCERCAAAQWQGGPMPAPAEARPLALDPRTAYQVVHMLEGVVERGTATRLRALEVPLMGKTGTTTGPTDAWFVGGTPSIVAGLYIGYDQPQPLGGWVQGGSTAAPIFMRWAELAFAERPLPVEEFLAPPGVRMVRVDRRTGRRVNGVFPTSADPRPAVIWEAFREQAEPRRRTRFAEADTIAAIEAGQRRVERVRSDSDFLRRQGGIY